MVRSLLDLVLDLGLLLPPQQPHLELSRPAAVLCPLFSKLVSGVHVVPNLMLMLFPKEHCGYRQSGLSPGPEDDCSSCSQCGVQ